MGKLYVVSLSDAELLLLQQSIKKGKAPARTTTRARILLKADAGPEGPEWTDTKIAEPVEVSRLTVQRPRKRAVLDSRTAVRRSVHIELMQAPRRTTPSSQRSRSSRSR